MVTVPRASLVCWPAVSRCLGLMILPAFQSYDESRSEVETKATVVVQQVEMGQFLPKDPAAKLASTEMNPSCSTAVNGKSLDDRSPADLR